MPNRVTPEQIARAKEIGIEEYILSREPHNVKRIGRALYLKDHDSLRISNGLWKWESQGIGGKNVIDYLIKVRGYDFVGAVRHLAGEDYSIIPSPSHSPPKSKPPPEHKPFALPRRYENNDRVIEYLQSRGIDEKLIQECIRQNVLYESADFHNAVFVGRDENSKARFAAMRGTLGDFKRDADGSDKRFGFCLPPENPQNNTVFVFESPIDLLSYDTLRKLGHIEAEDALDGWRLSLGCTAMAALTHFIEQRKFNNPIAHCVVCTDRDTAGDMAFLDISAKLAIKVSRLIPAGKDWNETLQQIRKEVNPLEDVRKDILFLEEPFKYPEAFRIKDGDSVKATYAYDGEVATLKCRYIDEAHLYIGNNAYHISELAEKLKKNGNKVEPIPGQKPMLDIIAGKYGEPLRDVTIPMTEAALKKLVGGKYDTEILYYPSRTIQAKDKIIEIKGEAYGALLRGRDGVAVCGMTDGKLTSLHPYNAQTQKRELSTEKPAPEKADMLNKIDKFKAKAAAQESTVPNQRKLQNALE